MIGLHIVWAVTALATVASVAFSDISAGEAGILPAAVGVMFIAAFKARLVLLYFMEVKQAPTLWRGLLEGWILLCAVVIAVLHL